MRTIEEIIYSEKEKLYLDNKLSCGWNEKEVIRYMKEYALEVVAEIEKNINGDDSHKWIYVCRDGCYIETQENKWQEFKNKINEQ